MKYSNVWKKQFKTRINRFRSSIPRVGFGESLSIKIRVTGGCFHREHSPNAYKIIDQYIDSHVSQLKNISFEEHESGPEILVYLSLAGAVINLAAAVITLITTIINARSKGIERGDLRTDPIELIVRRFDNKGNLKEEKLLTIHSNEIVSKSTINILLKQSFKKLFLSKRNL